MVMFKEAIHEDDEFTHAGGQCDQRFFSGGEQALVESLENAVMAHGTQSGHVEGATDGAPSATDRTDCVVLATIPVIRGDASQGGSRLMIERSQLGHFRQNRGGNDRADSGDSLQTSSFISQLGIFGDEGGNGLITLFNLFFQKAAQLPVLAAAEGVSVMFGVIAFDHHQANQLLSPLGPVCQLLLLRRRCQRGCRGKGFAIFGQDGRINGIGFGALALGPGEVTHTARFEDTHRKACGLEHTHDRLFITASGFANDLSVGISPQAFEELGVTFGIIGQGMEMAGQMELQRELGNVQANIEDRCIVLTHTCRIRATIMGCCRAQATVRVWDNGCARNGLQNASRQKRMLSAEVLRHTSLCPVATGQRLPAWDNHPSKDKEKIQVRGGHDAAF